MEIAMIKTFISSSLSNIHRHKWNFDTNKSNKGQSLLELSISFMVLLLLLGGVIDLGRLFFTYITLSDAAQEGAAFASYTPGNPSEAISRAKSISENIENDSNVIAQVTPSGDCANGTNNVTAVVTYQGFRFIMPLTSMFNDADGLDLKATVVDTIINPICSD